MADMTGYLVLADGTVYQGRIFAGSNKHEIGGEVVFNTAMNGYPELLTDPSYCGQIVALTYPLAGNYGVNSLHYESDRIQVRGLVVREACDSPSHWQSEMTLREFLDGQDIIGLEGIDTRALTRKIRRYGTMRGIICSGPRSAEELQSLAEKLKEDRSEEDLASKVTTSVPYFIPALPEAGRREVDPFQLPGFIKKLADEDLLDLHKEGFSKQFSKAPRIVVVDYGVKRNILRKIFQQGSEIIVVPYTFSAEEILRLGPDGIVLSNGPGDPKAVRGAKETVAEMIKSRIPILGICLGHQILALALGGNTRKLKFGHRGSNHPVVDLKSGRIFITSQNHGYVVEEEDLGEGIEVTARNLNDGTLEGFRHRHYPIIAVQYHPEGNPGPDDSEKVFAEFLQMVDRARNGH